MKSLDQLSSAELGKLFPIQLVDYNPDWKGIFTDEKEKLFNLLGKKAIRIEHIGSTAIPSIKTKPTIDILIEISGSKEEKDWIKDKLINNGYHFIFREDSPPPYMMFVKGYTLNGFEGQVYHIHIAEASHKGLWDRIYFRDYLIKHQNVAKEYEDLKLHLAKLFTNDREAYTAGKSEFVKRVTELAKREKSSIS